MASNRTIYLEYAPGGAASVKLKLVLPPQKTVAAATKAFAKAVAKSRPELPAIDAGAARVARSDGSVAAPGDAVGDAFAEGEALSLAPAAAAAPAPEAGGPCPDDGRPRFAAPGGNGPPAGAWLRVAGKGAKVRAGRDLASAEVATLKRGAEAWGVAVAWLDDGTPRVELAWPHGGWATLNVFEPFRVPDRSRALIEPAEVVCEPDDPGDWWAAFKLVSNLNAMPRLPSGGDGERGEWLERGDVALQADYFADAVGRYSRAIICAYRDQHLGKLASPDDYCVVYAMRALAFWRARGALPEPDRDAALFGVACLCAAGRDVAFAVAHASKAKVDDWLGADVVDAILRAAASRRVAVPEAAKAEAKVPFGGIRARDAA